MENNQKELILLKDLGMRYPTQKSKKKARYGLFKCFCGNEFEVIIQSTKRKCSKSCGCAKGNLKHNLYGHSLYKVWNNMNQRCNNPKNTFYKNYGGRGIKVCDEWLNVENFIRDMYPTFKEGLTIDRKDNNIGYSKENCRWVDSNIQSRNTRKIRTNNVSGYRGVSWKSKNKKWVAQIVVDSKKIHIGLFDNILNGALAYDNYIIANNLEHTKNFT